MLTPPPAPRRPRRLPRGRCPECGRVIAGRRVGNSRVALAAHKRDITTAHPADCLMIGGRRVVDRLPDGDAGEEAGDAGSLPAQAASPGGPGTASVIVAG